MSIENARGGYSFIQGLPPYSGGVVSLDGFEIEHVWFARWRTLDEAQLAIQQRLKDVGRPNQALCAVSLRIPRVFTLAEFGDVNTDYIKHLNHMDVLVDGVNPVARTCVAPLVRPPAEPVVAGFAYTVPGTGPAFVVAGAGELPEGSLDPRDIVRHGETSADAIKAKAVFVLGLMKSRMETLGLNWAAATAVNVYTEHDVPGLIRELGVPAVTWHHARPPIRGLEFEMDVRGCRSEVTI